MTGSEAPGMGAGPPSLAYWHLWTDDRCVSRQTHCEFTEFDMDALGPGDSPQWNEKFLDGGNAFLTVLPVGWSARWHMNQTAMWIVVLSGQWYVESMDGERVVIGPGEFSLGGDQGCKTDAQGRIGHLSGQVGDVPCVQLIIQNNEPKAWVGARPGDFK
jgi:hypothetical protein